MRVVRTLLAVMMVSGVTKSVAQHPQLRGGFWMNAGAGYGSLGCERCSDRHAAWSGNFSLGGALNQKVLLGVSSNAWIRNIDHVGITASTVTAAVRFYPATYGGFFLTGGLGYGGFRVSAPDATSTTGRAGALVGLGYDMRIGQTTSLTAFWNGFAIMSEGSNVNVGQVGLALSYHARGSRQASVNHAGSNPASPAAPASTPTAPRLHDAPNDQQDMLYTPPGMHFVADRKSKVYYSVDCSAVVNIPSRDRLFYETEPQAAGFKKATEC